MSAQDVMNHMAMHISQAEIATSIAVGELFVIHAKQVQKRGVQIVDVDLVFGGEVAVVICGPVGGACFDPGTGHPHGETFGIVIAAIGCALGHGGAAKFASPEHQGVFQETSRFEVVEQASDGLIHLRCVLGVAFDEIAMLIPLHVGVTMRHLNVAHAALGKAPRHEALPTEVRRDRIVESIEFSSGLGLAAEVLQFRHGRLHPVSKLKGVDPCFQHLGRAGLS